MLSGQAEGEADTKEAGYARPDQQHRSGTAGLVLAGGEPLDVGAVRPNNDRPDGHEEGQCGGVPASDHGQLPRHEPQQHHSHDQPDGDHDHGSPQGRGMPAQRSVVQRLSRDTGHGPSVSDRITVRAHAADRAVVPISDIRRCRSMWALFVLGLVWVGGPVMLGRASRAYRCHNPDRYPLRRDGVVILTRIG